MDFKDAVWPIIYCLGIIILAFWALIGVFILDWLSLIWQESRWYKFFHREKLPKIRRPKR